MMRISATAMSITIIPIIIAVRLLKVLPSGFGFSGGFSILLDGSGMRIQDMSLPQFSHLSARASFLCPQ